MPKREGVYSNKQGCVPFFKDFFPASQVGILHGMSSRFESEELPKAESSWTPVLHRQQENKPLRETPIPSTEGILFPIQVFHSHYSHTNRGYEHVGTGKQKSCSQGVIKG